MSLLEVDTFLAYIYMVMRSAVCPLHHIHTDIYIFTRALTSKHVRAANKPHSLVNLLLMHARLRIIGLDWD